MIRDSDFFLNIRRVKELCRLLIEKDMGIRLTSVNGRMEQLSRMGDDVWELIRGAGIHEIHKIICIYGERDRMEHMDILLSFFTPYPKTKLYEVSLKNGLKPLNTLEDWGDFDQFDFKAPWFPKEVYDIVKDFRAGMPWNSGCEFDDWCGFYEGIEERLDKL